MNFQIRTIGREICGGLTRKHGVILFCLLIFHLTVRYAWLDHRLFPDEAFTHGMVQGSLSDVLSQALEDVHPPFYYMTIWALRKPFVSHPGLWRPASPYEHQYKGFPVVRLYRLLNYFFVIPSVLLVFVLTRLLWREEVLYSWVVLVMLAVIPFGVYWDTTARQYPLMSLQGLFALVCILLYMRTGFHLLMVPYAITVLTGFYTNFYMYPYFAVFSLSGFLAVRNYQRAAVIIAVTAGLFVLSFALQYAFLPHMGEQIYHLSMPGEGARAQGEFYDTPWQAPMMALSTIGAMLIEVRSGYAIEWYNYPVLYLLLQILLAAGITGLFLRFHANRNMLPVFFLLWCSIAPIWLIDTYKLYGGSWLPRMTRHFYPSYPVVILFLGLGLVECYRKIQPCLGSERSNSSQPPCGE